MQDRPLLTRPDNFTPLARTPWAGHYLADVLKRGVATAGEPVGESWEVSFGPELPSQIEGEPRTLAEVASEGGARFLGREATRGSSALLVKLLDTAEPLSVQIHPSDADPLLAHDESGKPEAWYVVRAERGAAIHLGLSDEATLDRLRASIENGEDASRWLTRVPVEAGDFFVVPAGTPHAVGAGITLVEPQRVLPGRRGVTYRYWDWNRRYGEDGRPSPDGQPRALHLPRALAVTRWDAPRGAAFLSRVRARVHVDLDTPTELARVCGPGARLHSAELDVGVLAGSGPLDLPRVEAVQAWTVLEGVVRLVGDGFRLEIPRGRSAVVPAAVGKIRCEADHAHAVVASIVC
ncbi:MAG: type I phosphomannose isomerase catalytic subunit [Sandaracinus sp.]